MAISTYLLRWRLGERLNLVPGERHYFFLGLALSDFLLSVLDLV